MKKIPLTQGKTAQVDDKDFVRFSSSKWTATLNGGTWYAVRRGKKGERIYLHREVTAATKGSTVDHVSGDGLDNRRANLRICSHAQNLQNQKLRSNNTSGITGVTFDKQVGKWKAQIKMNYKNKSLGFFKTAKEVAVARRKYEKTIGWFGRQTSNI